MNTPRLVVAQAARSWHDETVKLRLRGLWISGSASEAFGRASAGPGNAACRHLRERYWLKSGEKWAQMSNAASRHVHCPACRGQPAHL